MGLTATLNTSPELIDVIINNNVNTPVFKISDQVLKLTIDLSPKRVTTIVENKNRTIKITEMPLGLKGETGDKGDPGPEGRRGPNGIGIPTGGLVNQVLVKRSFEDYDVKWINNPGSGETSDLSVFELELARKSSGNSYMEYTMDNLGNISQINYWSNVLKTTKLFTKNITWNNGKPTLVSIVNVASGREMRTTITYNGDQLLNVLKEVI